MESYIQYAEGYNKDDISIKDIRKAIHDVQEMDDEHGAFWVAVIVKEEYTLEVDKSMTISRIFKPDNDKGVRYKAKDWKEVEFLFGLLLDKKFDEIKQIIK
jgi:hypothetical protein